MTAPVFVVAPEGPARGGVVVIQEAFGITDHIKSVCSRLAAEGWYAVAPHLFHRAGDPVLGYDDYESAVTYLGQLNPDDIAADVDDAFAVLGDAQIDLEHTAITGFCMGGLVSLVTATTHHLGAAATWYGSGIRNGRFGFPATGDIAPSLKTPWLGLFGDEDQGIPVDDVEYLRGQAAKAPVRTEVVRYAEAGHGFNCDDRGSYAPAAAADGWARMLAFFDELVPAL